MRQAVQMEPVQARAVITHVAFGNKRRARSASRNAPIVLRCLGWLLLPHRSREGVYTHMASREDHMTHRLAIYHIYASQTGMITGVLLVTKRKQIFFFLVDVGGDGQPAKGTKLDSTDDEKHYATSTKQQVKEKNNTVFYAL